MTSAARIRVRLRLLIDAGSLASSACGREFMSFIEPLIAAGIVTSERSGAGRCLKVRDSEALNAWFRDNFPREADPDMPARVSAIAQFRDSKALPSDGAITVQIRCWQESALQCNGVAVSAASATRDHGLFTFALEAATQYRLCLPCAVIENPAVFHSFEKLGLTETLPCALYAGGRISARVLDWLASQNAPHFRLVHFPDYDPVGLSEFVRLRNALGSRVSLHLPSSIARCFKEFGNRKLLRNSSAQSLLAALRSNPLPEVQSVVQLMERHNCGLEQEVLLLDRGVVSDLLPPRNSQTMPPL